jgi:hypothetical protein
MKRRNLLFIICIFLPLIGYAQTISLEGNWRFKLDPKDKGTSEQWHSKTLSDEISLPGSCEEQGYGVKNIKADMERLTRDVAYEGKAWYQKDFEVPASWNGKHVELFLERCHWESNVWIDGRFIGSENTLSVPHVYDLGALAPGKHTVTVCIDNTYKIPIGTWAHGITRDTQTNWNGIIGNIEIRAISPLRIDNAAVYPDHIVVWTANNTGKVQAASILGQEYQLPEGTAKFELPFKVEGPQWDEFDRNMQMIDIVLENKEYTDTYTAVYANRNIGIKDKQVIVNGNPIMLRGTVDECVYPLTGYPPMDKESWARVFNICKGHGFNYMRYHSWCPPKAAFEAADEIGFYLQVEIPFWSMDAPRYGDDADRDQWLKDEVIGILDTYGNHPSFALMAMGNESSGPLYKLVNIARDYDKRHIYRAENGATYEHGDFVETGLRGTAGPRTDWDRWAVSGWVADWAGEGKLNEDSGASVDTGAEIPTLGHEIGQWEIYPNYDEIAKYTGNLKPYNMMKYRESLKAHGMMEQNKDFAKASGKFSTILYKEDVEAGIRTYPYAGFHVLEARDYPGQGAALVGWLDAFWDSKGLITPEEFKKFADATVLIMRMPERIFTSGDAFTGFAQIAHYGKNDFKFVPEWRLVDESGKAVASGKLNESEVSAGRISNLGSLEIPLTCDKAQKLTLILSGAGTENSWDIWVYPDIKINEPENVRIAYDYDKETVEALKNGERVILFADPTKGIFPVKPAFFGKDKVRNFKVTSKHNAVEGSFMPTFWNMMLFNQTGTMGILCQNEHPAFSSFPTEYHSNWQWADILGRFTAAQSFRTAGASADYCDHLEEVWGDVRNRSKAIVLNDAPEGYKPIVQAIDNYKRNYRLGVIFETKVGKGRLLVCALDLDTDIDSRPAAKCLKQSLFDYVSGPDFNPEYELDGKMLKTVLDCK